MGTSGLVVATFVTLLVHVLGVLLGVVLGLLAVKPVHTLALGELVDLAADDTGEELLSEGVADGLAYVLKSKSEYCSRWIRLRMKCGVSRTLLALVVLVGLHAGKGSGTGSELVGELALVVLLTVVHLLVCLLGFV